jgi:hypothetical protein
VRAAMSDDSVQTIDAYIAAFPDQVQPMLRKVR